MLQNPGPPEHLQAWSTVTYHAHRDDPAPMTRGEYGAEQWRQYADLMEL